MTHVTSAAEIRPYMPDDLVPAVDLWHQAWHDARPGEVHVYSIEQWRDRWRERLAPGSTIHVATLSGAVVGYVAEYSAKPWFSHVVVKPECRRRGIGTRLVETAKEASRAGLIFDVFVNDILSHAFYVRCGFTPGETVADPRTGLPMVRYTLLPD
jgi:GNAT superfamily N-acetyltransferase